ncbi:MAG: hypothetical protein U0S48_13980 [Solirubrobacteraceae bacterium]
MSGADRERDAAAQASPQSPGSGHQAPPAPPARCPQCGTELEPGQEWCLSCGTAARTVIAPTPNWRLPIAAVAVVLLLCGGALAWAFVALTDNDDAVRAATQTAPATTATTTTGATPTIPGATPTPTLPGATTTPAPGATPTPTATTGVPTPGG